MSGDCKSGDRSGTDLAEIARWSKQLVESEAFLRIRRSGIIERLRAGLGGSHTVVTYPPLDYLSTLDHNEIVGSIKPVAKLNLYLHVAFCEYVCRFCHYTTVRTRIGEGDDRRDAYVRALLKEVRRWKEHLGASGLESLYIGGGTPTVLPEKELVELIGALEGFKKRPGFRACVETSPVTASSDAGRKKLASLVGAGVGRFSIGVQSFDDRLLRTHRGHDLQVVLRAVENVMERNVESNVDLIQDLPGQTDESIANDVKWTSCFRPHQVTWYVLRFQPGSVWSKSVPASAGELAGSLESVRRRALIRRAMESIGYLSRPGGRFVRDASIEDTYKNVRSQSETNLLGVGASAYSHVWGYFFRNTPSTHSPSGVAHYIERSNRGELPVERGLRLDALERAAGKIVAGIRSRLRLPFPTPDTEAYLGHTKKQLDDLADLGLVNRDDEHYYSLTELGSLFEEEICASFYTDRVKQKLANETDTNLVGIATNSALSLGSPA